MAGHFGRFGGTPGGGRLEEAILDTPICNLTEKGKGMLPKPPRLLDSEGHQAMLATDRGHGFRIVRELPGLGLRCSQAGFVKASGSQHGKAEDGGDSGIDEEVPVPAVVVEPGDVARAGAVRAETTKFGTPPLATPKVGVGSTSSFAATPNGMGQHCVNSVETGAAATA